jgi:hypothetical protein
MRRRFLLFLTFACTHCTFYKAPSKRLSLATKHPHDCVLRTAPFEEANHELGDFLVALDAFTRKRDAILLSLRFHNTSSLNEVRLLDLEAHTLNIYQHGHLVLVPLSDARITQIDSLHRLSEHGSFRQLCAPGPSEGSSSLLLVKVNAVTVLKYEASQYDYTFLNKTETSTLKNALALASLLRNPASQ